MSIQTACQHHVNGRNLFVVQVLRHHPHRAAQRRSLFKGKKCDEDDDGVDINDNFLERRFDDYFYERSPVLISVDFKLDKDGKKGRKVAPHMPWELAKRNVVKSRATWNNNDSPKTAIFPVFSWNDEHRRQFDDWDQTENSGSEADALEQKAQRADLEGVSKNQDKWLQAGGEKILPPVLATSSEVAEVADIPLPAVQGEDVRTVDWEDGDDLLVQLDPGQNLRRSLQLASTHKRGLAEVDSEIHDNAGTTAPELQDVAWRDLSPFPWWPAVTREPQLYKNEHNPNPLLPSSTTANPLTQFREPGSDQSTTTTASSSTASPRFLSHPSLSKNPLTKKKRLREIEYEPGKQKPPELTTIENEHFFHKKGVMLDVPLEGMHFQHAAKQIQQQAKGRQKPAYPLILSKKDSNFDKDQLRFLHQRIFSKKNAKTRRKSPLRKWLGDARRERLPNWTRTSSRAEASLINRLRRSTNLDNGPSARHSSVRQLGTLSANARQQHRWPDFVTWSDSEAFSKFPQSNGDYYSSLTAISDQNEQFKDEQTAMFGGRDALSAPLTSVGDSDNDVSDSGNESGNESDNESGNGEIDGSGNRAGTGNGVTELAKSTAMSQFLMDNTSLLRRVLGDAELKELLATRDALDEVKQSIQNKQNQNPSPKDGFIVLASDNGVIVLDRGNKTTLATTNPFITQASPTESKASVTAPSVAKPTAVFVRTPTITTPTTTTTTTTTMTTTTPSIVTTVITTTTSSTTSSSTTTSGVINTFGIPDLFLPIFGSSVSDPPDLTFFTACTSLSNSSAR